MVRRPTVVVSALLVLAAVLAVPVLAGGNPNAPGQQKAKTPSTPISIAGTIERSAGADGETTYTLRDGGTTYTLEAGPSWFFGEDYPLDPFVGQTVSIDGEVAEGSTEVDVISIDGVALREPGRPPWAGGWKAVGSIHPGWSQAKADKFEEKAARFGGCWPPGHCKDKPNRGGPNDDAGAPEAE